MHVYFECIYLENIWGKMLLVVIFGWWVLSSVLLFSACFIMSTLFSIIRKKHLLIPTLEKVNRKQNKSLFCTFYKTLGIIHLYKLTPWIEIFMSCFRENDLVIRKQKYQRGAVIKTSKRSYAQNRNKSFVPIISAQMCWHALTIRVPLTWKFLLEGSLCHPWLLEV